jgi:uncharacterized membrane protein
MRSMTRFLETATLIAATLTMGLMAGIFSVFAHAIMPGLGRTDDRTFVGAFQSIDKAIINPWFMPAFMGALVLTGLAALLRLFGDRGAVLPWLVAAFVLYLAVVVITMGVNVPLNDALQQAGSPDEIADLAAAREQFDEPRWARWNVIRALASTAAFGCLMWALVLYGRAEG